MRTPLHGQAPHYDQAGTGPAILFLHDDPRQQLPLFKDCAPLAAAKLRVVVALVPADRDGLPIVALLKQLGIGRAVVIAIGKANHVLIDLLETHPERIASASFVADQALVKELRSSTDNPRIHALLRSGLRKSVAKAVARTCGPTSAYGAVQVWSARIVDVCRSGIRNCAGLLARFELPGLIQLDDDGDEEEITPETC